MTDCDDELPPAPQPAVVHVADDAVRSLLPRYLARRHADLERIDRWLSEHNYEAIRLLGHRLRGSGGAYCLDYVSDVGTALERAARAADAPRIRRTAAALAAWLEGVEIG